MLISSVGNNLFSAFFYAVFAFVFVRAVGDEYLAIALGPEGPGIAGRGKTAYENPGTGIHHFVVEHVDVAFHRFGCDGGS